MQDRRDSSTDAARIASAISLLNALIAVGRRLPLIVAALAAYDFMDGNAG